MSEHWTVRLQRQLDYMRLLDGTGDPFDDGYQEAIRELEDWLSVQPDVRSAQEQRA
jgi:hypothetical protein